MGQGGGGQAGVKEGKKRLRQEVLARRAQMAPAERAAASEAAAAHLSGFGLYQRARTVALFLSFGDEIDTWGVLREALAAGKEVYAPKVDREAKVLRWGVVRDLEADLVPGPYRGIPEPARAVPQEQVEPDLILVPGVAFDDEGYRIGYGGGYYDRCLARWRGAKVGFAFSCQRVQRVPREPHDIPVQWLVTEAGVVSFSPAGPAPGGSTAGGA